MHRGFGELVTNNGLLAAWPCTVHDAQGRAWQKETAGLVLASKQAGREGRLWACGLVRKCGTAAR